MYGNVQFSLSKSLLHQNALIAGVFMGFVGMHTLFAAEPIPTDDIRIKGDFVSVTFMHFAKNKPSELVVCDKAGQVSVFDNAGKVQRRWRVGGALSRVALFAISREADAYAVLTLRNELVVGRLSTPEKVKHISSEAAWSQICFSQDGKWLATSGNSLVKIWQSPSWVEMRHETWAGPQIHEWLAFTDDADAPSFVTAGYQTTGEIGKWSLVGGDKLRDYRGDPEVDRKFVDLATSPDSRWLVGVSCGSDKLVVWDVGSGELVARPDAFSNQTGCLGNKLAFSGDGRILACSHRNYPTGFKLYRVDGWKELGHFVIKDTVDPHDYEKWGVFDVAVDFTGSMVATRHGDGHVRLWNVSGLERPQK
jgi:WD40 repeat protein